LLAEIFRTETTQTWLTKLRAAGVPASPIRRLDEVVNAPQSAARAMFPFINDASSGPLQVVGAPIKFSETPGIVSAGAPALGQHTRESLFEWLEMDESELDQLRSAGVIAQND
jgi:crotonobetainyl-CoA:carnitine CoA-transferase CaiB-like acyl-CoA transferase